jgi:hypothetical protein
VTGGLKPYPVCKHSGVPWLGGLIFGLTYGAAAT